MYTIMAPFLLYGERPTSLTSLPYGATSAIYLSQLQANTLFTVA